MIASHRARVILVSLIALCALFVYSYATRLVELAAVEAEVATLQTQVAEAYLRQQQLDAELAALDDPDFIDRVAREDFDMAKPGDKVLVVIRETPNAPGITAAGAAAAAQSPAAPRSQPVWRQWVEFFAADMRVLP